MDDRVILRVGAKMLIPFIMIFGLYVHFHGDYGPGGGFQAGVIFASAFVLYSLVFGLGNAIRVLPPKVAYICSALGVAIYLGVGFLGIILGGEFMDYNVLAYSYTGQHYGIIGVELGVVTTVFGVMVALFYAFAGRRRVDS